MPSYKRCARAGLPEAALPANAPTVAAVARKIGAAQQSQLGQLPASQLPGPALPNMNAAAYEAANKLLEQSGQHIEALGSDAMQRWMQEDGIEEMKGGYWQRLAGGQMALIEVQPPKEVLEAEQLGNAEISSLMFRCALSNSVECMKSTLKLSTYYLCMKHTINRLNDV